MVEPHIEGFVKLCPFWHTPYCSETEIKAGAKRCTQLSKPVENSTV